MINCLSVLIDERQDAHPVKQPALFFLSLNSNRVLKIVLAITCVVKLSLAICTYGTNDVSFFTAYSQKAGADGGLALYAQGAWFRTANGTAYNEPFWHPPFIINLLALWSLLCKITGLSFGFVFRFFSILADVGSSLIAWRLLQAWRPQDSLWTACLFAASPVLIFMSGFHGNTDPIMIFFLLLAVWLMESGRQSWLCGLAFGASISIKVWPIIFFPVLVLYLKTWTERVKFCLFTGVLFIVAGMPYLAENPALVIGKVTKYTSLYGHWGLSRIIPWFSIGALNGFFLEHGRVVISCICLAAAVWMHFKSRANLVTRMGVVCALFLSLTPGFGIQYLSWLLPWLVVLGWEFILLYSIAAGFFMAMVYSWWSGGFPWYYADSLATGTWKGGLVWYELLCWAVTLYICAQFLKAAGFSLRLSKSMADPVPVVNEPASSAPAKPENTKRRPSRASNKKKR